MQRLLGQGGGREGEGSWRCGPVVSWGLETLQVPLAAIEGDMWDRFQSRQQTPSNKPISFTLLTPTAAERGGLLLLWPSPAGCWRILVPAQAPAFPVGTGTDLECVDWLPQGTDGSLFVFLCQ